MTDPQHEFRPYPVRPAAEAAGNPNPDAADWILVVLARPDSAEGMLVRPFVGPMTEATALASIEAICRGRSVGPIQVDANCDVVQVSDREVVIHRTGFLSSTVTRVQVGRLRVRRPASGWPAP